MRWLKLSDGHNSEVENNTFFESLWFYCQIVYTFKENCTKLERLPNLSLNVFLYPLVLSNVQLKRYFRPPPSALGCLDRKLAVGLCLSRLHGLLPLPHPAPASLGLCLSVSDAGVCSNDSVPLCLGPSCKRRWRLPDSLSAGLCVPGRGQVSPRELGLQVGPA